MKKFILGSLLAIGLVFASNAQVTNTPPVQPPGTNASGAVLFGEPATTLINFLQANSTNWMVVPFGTYDLDRPGYGGGVAFAYRLNTYLWPSVRFDYLHGDVWMTTADIQLGVPITIMGKLTVVPLTYAGIGTPISGAGDRNGTAASILGAGAAIRLSSRWDLIGAYEKVGSLDLGNKGQVRVGLGYKF